MQRKKTMHRMITIIMLIILMLIIILILIIVVTVKVLVIAEMLCLFEVGIAGESSRKFFDLFPL